MANPNDHSFSWRKMLAMLQTASWEGDRMALPDLDSSVGHSFGLEFDGVVIKQIAEVSGLKIGQDVVEFKQDTDSGKFIVKKLPGRPKAGEVTLTRGLTHDSSFEDWIRDSQFGKVPDARKGGAIIVFDFEGAVIKRYKLMNARLKTLVSGSLKAGRTNVPTEKLILTHDG
jgi:phage tail-like protein